MKKWFMIFCLLTVFTACSEDNELQQKDNPFSPVSDLKIPVREKVGTEILIKGEGFAEDCQIWLQLNEGGKFQTEIIKVDQEGVVFSIQSVKPGFYVVILVQQEQEYRIGGINLTTDDLDKDHIEAWCVQGETNPVVCPVNITDKIVGQPLFKLRPGYYFGTIVSAADGNVYYSGFDIRYDEVSQMTRTVYYLEYYSTMTGKQQSIPYEKVDQYFAMGLIDGELHVLRTENYKIFTLVKLKPTGEEILVKEFDFTPLGVQKIWNDTQRFDYDPRRNAIFLSIFTGGENPQNSVYVLNVVTAGVNAVATNGSERLATVVAGNDIYYFGRNGDEDHYITRVFFPGDPLNWHLNDPEAYLTTLDGVDFSLPWYSASQNKIHGIGGDETVVTLDLSAPAATPRKWVKSGCVYLFDIDFKNN